MTNQEMEDWLNRYVNLETMREMEESIPMLPVERTALRRWTNQGNNPETNPWGYLDEDGHTDTKLMTEGAEE